MIQKSTLILLLLFSAFNEAFASLDAEYSRSGSGENFSNNLSLGLNFESFVDEKTERVGLSSSIGYSYTNSNALVSLVTTSPDFQISSNSHDLNFTATFLEKFSINLNAGITDYNNNESRSQSAGVGLYYQFSKVQVGIGYGTADYYQVKPVILTLGNTDITDRMKFRQVMSGFYLDWQVTEFFMMKLNSAYYKYEIPNAPNISTLDQFSNFMTSGVTNVLSLSGGSWASEIQNQPAASTDLAFLYNFSENWLVEFSLGNSRDQLSPQSPTNSIGIGFEYSNEIADFGQLRIFGSVEGSKTKDIDQNFITGTAGLGISF